MTLKLFSVGLLLLFLALQISCRDIPTPLSLKDKDSAQFSGSETTVTSNVTETEAHSEATFLKASSADEPIEGRPFGPPFLLNNFLTAIVRWIQPFSKLFAIQELFFLHAFVFSIVVLLNVLFGGVGDALRYLRTPPIIYKEVEAKEVVAPEPAPVYPPPHKDYGYTGGFKTPEGMEVEYHPYYKEKEPAEHKHEEAHYEKPPGNNYVHEVHHDPLPKPAQAPQPVPAH